MPRRGSAEWPVVPPDAPILGAPRASPRRIARYVEHIASSAGWRAFDPAAVGKLVDAYAVACEAAGLDPLLVVCHLLVETDELRTPSTGLRINAAALARGAPVPDGWHTSWRDAASSHAELLLAAGPTLADVAAAWGETRRDEYRARLLQHTDAILMPQY